jgi:outer membrane protein OmpA-like peptidoglycan-associated protein
MRKTSRWISCASLALFALCILGFSGRALADPVRISTTNKVFAPAKPALHLLVDEPVTQLQIDLLPQASDDGKASTESAPQQLRAAKLTPGKKVSFAIGTGKPGVTAWRGMIQGMVGGKLWKRPIDFQTEVSKRLEIRFDRNFFSEHLSLEKHYVDVQISAPAGRGEINVTADDGSSVGRGEVTFHGEAPDTWLRIPWQPRAPTTAESVVLRLALVLYDQEGNAGSIDLYPWHVTVPHEDVTFASNSSEITDAEASKLDESLRKITTVLDRVERTLLSFAEKGIIAGVPKPKLFVAGHTDTVGGDNDNLVLSRARAKAIAAHFRAKGFRLAVYFAGCGERQLRVKTSDSVDEARNRRADYTLALEAPALPSGVTWHTL